LDEFKNWLKSILKLNEEDAQKHIEAQEAQYKQALGQNQALVIPALGRIFKDDSDKVKFEADEQLRQCFEFAYPDLPLIYFRSQQYLQKVRENSAVSIPAMPKLRGIPWYIYLTGMIMAAFLLSLAISYFAGFSNFINNNKNQAKTAITTTPSPESDTTNIFESGETIKDTQITVPEKKIEVVTEPVIEEKPLKQEKSPVANSAQPEDPAEALEDIIALSNSGKEQLSNPLIIIVGSFKKPAQVIKMLQTIKSSGYNGFVTKFGPYYRTGVLLEETPEKTDSVLNEIKAKFEKSAWILTE
jgi:cell division septation protein DedD